LYILDQWTHLRDAPGVLVRPSLSLPVGRSGPAVPRGRDGAAECCGVRARSDGRIEARRRTARRGGPERYWRGRHGSVQPSSARECAQAECACHCARHSRSRPTYAIVVPRAILPTKTWPHGVGRRRRRRRERLVRTLPMQVYTQLRALILLPNRLHVHVEPAASVKVCRRIRPFLLRELVDAPELHGKAIRVKLGPSLVHCHRVMQCQPI